MENYKKMLITIIGIGVFLLITACSFPRNKSKIKQLPELANINTKQHHEIQSISGYPESTLFHVKTNNTYIVSTRLRTYGSFNWRHYWRISAKGELLESFAIEGLHDFTLAGVLFNKTSYIDWPLTGDTHEKKYHQIINGNNIDENTLKNYFSESEDILWNKVYTNNDAREEYHLYLKKQNQWTLIISDKALFDKLQSNWPSIRQLSAKNSNQDESVSNANHKLPATKKTYSQQPLTTLDWTEVEFTLAQPTFGPVNYKGFKSEYSVKPSFMSQSGWTGRIGKGALQVLFDNQVYDFKTYMRETTPVHSEYSPKMHIYHSPPSEALTPFLLLQLNAAGSGIDRDDSEAGIYILRKVNSFNSNDQSLISQIQFKDFQIAPVIRWVTDTNGYREDWPNKFSAKDVKLPKSLKKLPAYIDFYFSPPQSIIKNSTINLIINDKTWKWENSASIYATLYLDQREMTDAIRELGSNNLTLSIKSELQEQSIKLIMAIESTERSIHLKKATLVSKSSES